MQIVISPLITSQLLLPMSVLLGLTAQTAWSSDVTSEVHGSHLGHAWVTVGRRRPTNHTLGQW